MEMRLTNYANWTEKLQAMAEGDDDALMVCREMLAKGDAINPYTAYAGLKGLRRLDELGIYGKRIRTFYEDVCEKSLPMMLAILRMNQTNLLTAVTDEKIYNAIDDGEKLNLVEIQRDVKKILPDFLWKLY